MFDSCEASSNSWLIDGSYSNCSIGKGTGMAVVMTLSLEDAIDALEANLVNNGEATTLYWLYTVHIFSGFRILLRRFENTLPRLAALLKMPQNDATRRAGQSKLYRCLYGILWVSCARIWGQALLKLLVSCSQTLSSIVQHCRGKGLWAFPACGTCPIAAIWLPRAANFFFVFSLASPASFVGSERD